MSLRDLLDGLPVDVDTDPDTMAEAAFSRGLRSYRYALTRTWEPRATVLPWVMLNPSTADAFRLDPTVTRCADFSRRWGYGGLVVLNLYAYRSTDPRALRGVWPSAVGPSNDDVIGRWLAALAWRAPSDVVCAWGSNAEPGRARHVVQLIRDAGHRPARLGINRDGQPRHPLYVRSATTLEPV